MSSARRGPLLLVVVVVLAATGVVTSLRHAVNPSTLPSGLTVSSSAESSALYCTGLSDAPGRPGQVTFYNTTASPRSLSVSVVSSRGVSWTGSIEIAAHDLKSVYPSVVDHGVLGESFGVAALVTGGGVVGEEIAGTSRTSAPCAAEGTSHWYATGFDTLVGSSAYLSVYNPTATAAVFNVTVYTAAGVAAPVAFQGLSVPAHAESEIDLGREVVNTANVGVSVDVLRGSLEIVGVDNSNGTVSLDQGSDAPTSAAWFPGVTTAQTARAEIRLANPNDAPAEVSVTVQLGTYRVVPQAVTLPPFATGTITITPNSAIPAAGYANLSLRSNEPVISSLATGTGDWVALSSPVLPGSAFVVSDLSDVGFGAASVTNTTARTLSLYVKSFVNAQRTPAGKEGPIKVDAGTTVSLFDVVSTFSSTPSDTYLLTAPKGAMVVALSLPSKPPGINVVAPLDGR